MNVDTPRRCQRLSPHLPPPQFTLIDDKLGPQFIFVLETSRGVAILVDGCSERPFPPAGCRDERRRIRLEADRRPEREPTIPLRCEAHAEAVERHLLPTIRSEHEADESA